MQRSMQTLHLRQMLQMFHQLPIAHRRCSPMLCLACHPGNEVSFTCEFLVPIPQHKRPNTWYISCDLSCSLVYFPAATYTGKMLLKGDVHPV